MKILCKKACGHLTSSVKVYRRVLSLLLLQPCQVIIMTDEHLFEVLRKVCFISIDLNIKRIGRGRL